MLWITTIVSSWPYNPFNSVPNIAFPSIVNKRYGMYLKVCWRIERNIQVVTGCHIMIISFSMSKPYSPVNWYVSSYWIWLLFTFKISCHNLDVVIILIWVWSIWHGDNMITCITSLAIYNLSWVYSSMYVIIWRWPMVTMVTRIYVIAS